MSDERYQLIYSGLAEGADAKAVKAHIQERFQLPIARIEKWFGKHRAVVGSNLSQDQAWKSQYLFESVGVKTIVVQQPRSNLSLSNLQVQPSRREPSVTVSHFQPTGMAEFEARPLSHRPVAVSRRRRSASQRSERSFRLSHILAAAFVVVVFAYAGKQMMVEGSPMAHVLASFSQSP